MVREMSLECCVPKCMLGCTNVSRPPYVKSDDYALTQGEEGVGDV